MEQIEQNWKVGNHPSVIVSDVKIQNNNFPSPPNNKESADEDVKYYGGYLVCESVGNSKLASMISAAPDLLEALKEMVRMYEEVEPAGGWQGVYEMSLCAIKKATGQ